MRQVNSRCEDVERDHVELVGEQGLINSFFAFAAHGRDTIHTSFQCVCLSCPQTCECGC